MAAMAGGQPGRRGANSLACMDLYVKKMRLEAMQVLGFVWIG